jgi:hypothetical protein
MKVVSVPQGPLRVFAVGVAERAMVGGSGLSEQLGQPLLDISHLHETPPAI